MRDLDKKIKVCDESDSDGGEDDDDIIEQLRRDQEYYPVKEQEGLYYKVNSCCLPSIHQTKKQIIVISTLTYTISVLIPVSNLQKHSYRAIDMYHKRLFTLLPETPMMKNQRKQKRKLTHLEEIEEHTFSVR